MGWPEYAAVIRERWRLVVGVLVLVVAGASLGTVLADPVYRSQAELFVATDVGSDAVDLAQGGSFTQQRVQSYAGLVSTPRVLEPVAEELELSGGVAALRSMVSASTESGSVVLAVTATAAGPELAAALANATATQLVAVIEELETRERGGSSPVRLSLVQPGEVPSGPDSPDPVRNLALGLVLGALLGVGAALLRELTDTQVRDEQDVAAVSDVGVLARLTEDESAARRPLVVHTDTYSPRSEEFRKLRTSLQFVQAARALDSITITSALPGEGKSLTAANLAITMAAAGTRVCLVDADLRRPRLGDYLGLDSSVGLTTVLTGQADLADVLQPWGGGAMSVLLTGQLPPNPSELLGSSGMAELLERLEHDHDVVVVDAPPLLPVTDGAVVARVTGGALLVAAVGSVRRADLAQALATLTDVGADAVGVVLNRVPARTARSQRYYATEDPAARRTSAMVSSSRRGRRRQPRRTQAG